MPCFTSIFLSSVTLASNLLEVGIDTVERAGWASASGAVAMHATVATAARWRKAGSRRGMGTVGIVRESGRVPATGEIGEARGNRAGGLF